MIAEKPILSTQPAAAPRFACKSLPCAGRANRLYTLWLAILATAIVAAVFGASFLTYAKLTTYAPDQSVETSGDPWDSAIP